MDITPAACPPRPCVRAPNTRLPGFGFDLFGLAVDRTYVSYQTDHTCVAATVASCIDRSHRPKLWDTLSRVRLCFVFHGLALRFMHELRLRLVAWRASC
jgi:hypothetical protein